MDAERGQATIETAALAALIALILMAVIAAIADDGEVKAGRELAGAIGRRIACAPHLPDACDHEPVVPAYGWPLARLTRALAPPPEPLPAADGLPLVPGDFRLCRRASCALSSPPPTPRRWCRSTSCAAAARAAPSPPVSTSPPRTDAPPSSPNSSTTAAP